MLFRLSDWDRAAILDALELLSRHYAERHNVIAEECASILRATLADAASIQYDDPGDGEDRTPDGAESERLNDAMATRRGFVD
jgi:hypothetical protein